MGKVWTYCRCEPGEGCLYKEGVLLKGRKETFVIWPPHTREFPKGISIRAIGHIF